MQNGAINGAAAAPRAATPRAPLISVIMANYRGGKYLGAAMQSVLDQTHGRLELLLADDASDDQSLAVAEAIAARDPRVRLLPSQSNQGPAATRNRALEAARGDWIAIVDSDDLIHPERLARLLAVAQETKSDIVADDLVHFGAPETPGGRTLLQPLSLTRPLVVDVALFLRGASGDPRVPGFGYLKPLISRAVLGAQRYDTSLQIGEDYDLILRLLIRGARYLLLPDPLYAYRRHRGSISHRLSVEHIAAMLAAHRALPRMPSGPAQQAAAAVDRHLRRSLRYETLVRDIKARRLRRILPRLADPAMLGRLMGSVRDRRRREQAQSAQLSIVNYPVICPAMTSPGDTWTASPAPAAAAIAAEAGAGRSVCPADAPPWACWLDDAVCQATQG